ncbi:hypothetical protein ABIA43_002596 [Bradyrhizobium sp. USDA 328]
MLCSTERAVFAVQAPSPLGTKRSFAATKVVVENISRVCCALAYIDRELLHMPDIGRLICGEPLAEGRAKVALQQLTQSVEAFASRAIRILTEEDSDEATALGPFFARVLLENSCAALVGRLDPFRILYLSEFQGQPEYEHGRRARSAFSWFGDVIPAEEKNSELWNLDHEASKIGRALFSKHIDHVCWQPAVESMLDFVSAHGSDPLLRDILSLGSETYVKQTKGQSQQL